MAPFSQEISQKIEYLSVHQFKNRIPVTSIINWLTNFQTDEIHQALQLLDKTEYFTLTDLSNIINGYINDFLIHLNLSEDGATLHFVPLGEAGKSGHVISYLVKNLFKGRKIAKNLSIKYYNNIQEVDLKTLTEKDFIFYLDDIIGSGSTFLNIACDKETIRRERLHTNAENDGAAHAFFKSDIRHHNILMSCIIMAVAKERIERLLPGLKIYGEIRHKAFDKRNSPFHSYKTILILREMSYRYGKLLIKNEKNILGFDNSQALILFDHATPNNTLPILWMDSNNWTPLLSRYHTFRIKHQASNRETNNRWLIKLSDLFDIAPEEIVGSNLFSPKNYILSIMLRLRLKQWDDIDIARELGLTLNEILEYRANGVKANLWDEEFRPTSNAIDRIRDVEKKIRLSEEEDSYIYEFDDCNQIYVPKTFGGKS